MCISHTFGDPRLRSNENQIHSRHFPPTFALPKVSILISKWLKDFNFKCCSQRAYARDCSESVQQDTVAMAIKWHQISSVLITRLSIEIICLNNISISRLINIIVQISNASYVYPLSLCYCPGFLRFLLVALTHTGCHFFWIIWRHCCWTKWVAVSELQSENERQYRADGEGKYPFQTSELLKIKELGQGTPNKAKNSELTNYILYKRAYRKQWS